MELKKINVSNAYKFGGVSTWLWQSPFTTESVALFPKIKELGFDLVEIPVEDPSLIDGKVVKEELKKNGLEPQFVGGFLDLQRT